MAAVDSSKELMFVRNLLLELQCPPVSCHVSTDSDGAFRVVNKPGYRGRVRHMDLRWHYLRHLVEDNVLSVGHVPGAHNPADALTKSLPSPRLTMLVDKFMSTV